MAKKNERHVVPNEDGWSSKKAGAEKASKNFETKKEAEQCPDKNLNKKVQS
ncbi:MAG: DUF2188 domain-containing protein [Bacteroidales bacterium]|nr:DUF2188 domain-containing protein [Bacteroidales bacterium]